MKTINFLIGLFLLLICPVFSSAQDAIRPTDTKRPVSICDAQIDQIRAVLQEKANATCKTMKHTVQCAAGSSKESVFMVVIAQPDPKKCSNAAVINVMDQAEPKSRGEAVNSKKSAKPVLDFEILQEKCEKGGVTLTFYVPDLDSVEKEERYKFEWKYGEKVETDDSAECVSNDDATLRVTDKTTGTTVITHIELDRPPSNPDRKE